MLNVCVGAVTRIFLVSSFMLEIVLWKLDCSGTFYSGSLDGTLTTLEGGNVVTQFPCSTFFPLFTIS